MMDADMEKVYYSEEELKACGCEIVLDKIRVANVPSDEDLQEITANVKMLNG